MIENLMFNTALVQRPALENDSVHSQYISDWIDLFEIPCNVQPVSAKDEAFYLERGMEVSHNVFTNYEYDYQRNWRLVMDGRNFHVTGVRDFITLHRVWELNCVEYPSPAKKR